MTKAEKKQEKTTGVDVRATSIRLQFKGPDGTRHRITMVDAGGKPLPPTVAKEGLRKPRASLLARGI